MSGRRISYLVSRFPTSSETFIVREMNAVSDRHGDLEIGLMSLFPSPSSFLHPSAERWMEVLVRPTAAQSAFACVAWMLRRPIASSRAVGAVIAGAWRSPRTMGRSLVTLPLAAAHARRIQREDGIDHIHAHFAAYPTLAAWLIRRLTGIPYSFTAHAYDIFLDQSLLALKLDEAEFAVTISEYNRRFLSGYQASPPTPIEVIHCGIDPLMYECTRRAIPSDGPVTAACVATLEEKKGHAVLLAALASSPRLDRMELELVGDGPLRADLERQAAALGLSGRVRFRGSLTEAEVAEVLARAHIFVLPSIIAPDGQMEGLPVALMEALASGLTAVSTRQSGIPELIRDGETGYLAEPGDPNDLARALERALTGDIDPAKGRALVEEEFDIRSTADRMYELLTA
ncbi:MAG: glycosyltransferase [Solirubrobacterales bacterium]|nr:glycosyltransferase [Solirubrobacterales bacterium]MCB8970317.1 glycosyltransferase [Thermoleophilales bacterium]MCO5325480.1 glycosyltransferase [Solirubrobacterales bacterium]